MQLWKWVLVPGVFLLAGCSLDTAEVRKKESDAGQDIVIDYNKKGETKAETKSTSGASEKQGGNKNNPVTSSLDMHDQKTYASAPAMQIDTKKTYTATLKTALGDITIELAAQATPITVNNFVFLAKEKFYDNVIFHRTIKNFMIQGGDPTGTGMGGPGYRFDDEPFTGEYERGVVAMANAGPDTNGSQFFIMHATVALPKNYVIFGKVTQGMEVVDKIAEAPTQPGGEGSKPVTPIEIQTIEITEGK